MSEIDALPINLIKLSFSDTLPLVYIIRTVLIRKYSGLEGSDWGGRGMSFPFLAGYIKFNLFIFNYIGIQGYFSLFCSCFVCFILLF